MKRILLSLIVVIVSVIALCSCSRQNAAKDKVEGNVLIEFAARLEEDYHRFHPGTKDIGQMYPASHANGAAVTPTEVPANTPDQPAQAN